MPPVKTIKFERGQTHVETLFAVDDDGQPIDLTGAQLMFSMRPIPGSPIVLLAKTNTTGMAVDADQAVNKGKYTITFAHADTVGITTPPATYSFDVWAIIGSSYTPLTAPSQVVIGQIVTALP